MSNQPNQPTDPNVPPEPPEPEPERFGDTEPDDVVDVDDAG